MCTGQYCKHSGVLIKSFVSYQSLQVNVTRYCVKYLWDFYGPPFNNTCDGMPDTHRVVIILLQWLEVAAEVENDFWQFSSQKNICEELFCEEPLFLCLLHIGSWTVGQLDAPLHFDRFFSFLQQVTLEKEGNIDLYFALKLKYLLSFLSSHRHIFWNWLQLRIGNSLFDRWKLFR